MSTTRSRSVIALVVATSLWSAVAAAEPIDPRELPPELEDWVPWVVEDVPELACPVVQEASVCFWPGVLELQLDDRGGSFRQEVHADRELMVPLPGDSSTWPQDVKAGGRPAVVLSRNGRPAVRVEAGATTFTGRFVFAELPEGIRIPTETGLVTLTVRGESIPFPRREEDGLLWLKGAATAEEEDERLDVTVMRKIGDGVPLSVATHILLRASGKSREVTLDKALVSGTVPLTVSADIPAQVDRDGNLRLQVRAGTHTVSIVARTEGAPEKLAPPVHGPPWPEEEIWVWQAEEKLRQVVISGAPGIDPSRTNLPDGWRDLPAFLLGPGVELEITTTRRGEPEPPPDQITLDREIWMDLSGDGYTMRDSLSGTLSSTWRLDLTASEALGHVVVNYGDQLITSNPESDHPGVELRRSKLDLTAEWRLEGKSRELPAVGWSEDVQQLDATLHLPPGWTLLSASGVDELPGTWWDRWDLFSFFFVLIVSLAVGKLTRWPFGAVAFVALVLSHEEPGAPFIVWIGLLVCLGLLKVLPRGKLRIAGTVAWWSCVIWLVVVLVPFSVTQVRTGLFPQVGQSHYGTPDFVGFADQIVYEREEATDEEDVSALMDNAMMAGGAVPEAPVQQMVMKGEDKGLQKPRAQRKLSRGPATDGSGDSLDLLLGAGSASRGNISNEDYRWLTKKQALQQDPKAVVQTGHGVPRWHWNRWRLSWSGPVTKDHRFELYLVSPRVNFFLAIARVLLLVLLALRVAYEARRALRSPPEAPPSFGGAKKAVAGAAVALALITQPLAARAEETPVPSILAELKARLTRPADCRPDCVSASRLHVAVADDVLTLSAEVHAGAPSSWRIPGPARNWTPATVTLNGRPTSALAVGTDGFLHVRVDAGLHTVRVSGPVPPGNSVTLELGDLPHRATAEAPGWSVEGLREDGRTESSVQLTRLAVTRDAAVTDDGFEEGAYPPWLEVSRTLDLGIPWLVHTTVKRVSPPGSPVLARIPLLPGESVTESELQVEDGAVVLSLGRNDTELSWSSTLEEQPGMTLVAPENEPWTEVWILSSSPVWQCAFDGLAPVHRLNRGGYKPTFRPWPGEKLDLTMTRPDGVEGQSVTVDSARLQLHPGIRLVKADLTMIVRASRGGVQEITLPEGASVQELTVDGNKQPFRLEGRRLEVTLKPGSQSIAVTWQRSGGIRTRYRAPEVSIGGRAANVSVVVHLPRDRWLLWTGGPSWGPAILFWGFLLTILLAGLILGRIRLSRLKSWQWMLLSLGLTQVPVPVALIIVMWFFALAWRANHPPSNFVLHNGLQIVLGVWTLVAVGCLVGAVYQGLAVQPDMQVEGCDSTNTQLVWYVDQIDGKLPRPFVLSLPLVVWKLTMLGWALWLAASIVRWAPWAWHSFSAKQLWVPAPPPKKRTKPAPKPAAKPAAKPESKKEDPEPKQ